MQYYDKSTFLKKYRSEHPEIYVYLIFELIFDIAGTIIIAINVIDIINHPYRSDEPEIIFFIILGIFFWILGLIFLSLIKKTETNGIREYENFLMSHTPTQSAPNAWFCPRCGCPNDNSHLYCSRCSQEKPYISPQQRNPQQMNRNTISANSWICPNCGKENQNYVGTCGCGQVKPK